MCEAKLGGRALQAAAIGRHTLPRGLKCGAMLGVMLEDRAQKALLLGLQPRELCRRGADSRCLCGVHDGTLRLA